MAGNFQRMVSSQEDVAEGREEGGGRVEFHHLLMPLAPKNNQGSPKCTSAMVSSV